MICGYDQEYDNIDITNCGYQFSKSEYRKFKRSLNPEYGFVEDTTVDSYLFQITTAEKQYLPVNVRYIDFVKALESANTSDMRYTYAIDYLKYICDDKSKKDVKTIMNHIMKTIGVVAALATVLSLK